MPRVFCVGDLNIDIFSRADSFAEFGEEKAAEWVYYSVGGNAANFALAVSSLGAKTSLVSALGDDIFSGFLKDEMREARVELLCKKSPVANGVSNILVKGNGERAILSTKGALLSLDAKTVTKKLLPRLRKGDIVFFGGYYHLVSLHTGFSSLLQKIRGRGAKVFFDTCFDEHGKWPMGFARHVDLLFVNETELMHITGKTSLRAGVQKLFSLGAKRIVVKLAKKGAAYFEGDFSVKARALRVKVLNATGAGDYFNAGFVFALLNGLSTRDCLRSGNVVAAKKISSKRAGLPDAPNVARKILAGRKRGKGAPIKPFI